MPKMKRTEEGYSMIEFPAFILAMLVFVCVFAELGTYTFTAIAADNASYAAARALAQDVTLTDDDLRAAALTASPSLSDDEVDIDSTVSDVVSEPYVHHLPAAGSFEDRESVAARRDVTATVGVTWEPLTFLGRALAAASGEEALSVASTHHAIADATIEGGTSPW